jgi:hypothetical protein
MTSNPDRAKRTGVRMITTKPLLYATRRLQAGDEFYATKAHADVLVKLKKARYPDQRPPEDLADMPAALRARIERGAATKGEVAPPPGDLVERAIAQTGERAAESVAAFDHDGKNGPGGSAAPEQTDELAALRSEYMQVTGRRFFAGWTVEQLRQRIAEAKGAA